MLHGNYKNQDNNVFQKSLGSINMKLFTLSTFEEKLILAKMGI